MSSKRPKIYFIANNGIKIELKGFQSTEVMLIPDKELVGVIVHEPRMNVALTDELKAKGSINVIFKYGEVSECSGAEEKNHMM